MKELYILVIKDDFEALFGEVENYKDNFLCNCPSKLRIYISVLKKREEEKGIGICNVKFHVHLVGGGVVERGKVVNQTT